MLKHRPLFLIFLVILAVVLNGCSDQGSSTGYVYENPEVTPEDPVVPEIPSAALESCFVKQGSGQCGPASFYMIFKFYGDNKIDTGFWDLPLCSTEYSLKEELSTVTKDSLVSSWLGVANSGITVVNLDKKIRNLTADKAAPYYTVISNTSDGADNAEQFETINSSFLQKQKAVIIHVSRPDIFGIPLAGHFMVLAGYDSASGRVYFIDPNKNDDDPVLQSVSLAGFLNSSWYRSPDYSLTYPVPDAYWDGTWIGFTHAE